MFWITSNSLNLRRRLLWQGLATFLLLVGLSACGNKRSMEAARSDDELGSTHVQDDATHIEGVDDSVSFDEAAAARHRRVAGIKGGNTRSGPGKLNSVTTKAGDTLWKIAARKDIYGSGWLYPLIYKANRDLIKNPSQLAAGLLLKIPRDVPDAEVEIAKEEAMTGQILDQSPLPGALPSPVATPTPPRQAEGAGHGWLWALLLLLVAGAGAWVWMKKRAKPDA